MTDPMERLGLPRRRRNEAPVAPVDRRGIDWVVIVALTIACLIVMVAVVWVATVRPGKCDPRQGFKCKVSSASKPRR